ncbi:MAG: RsiV family protein [Acidobacteriota bacterium]
MSSPKQILIAISLLVFFGAAACRRTSPPNQLTAADSTERQHPDGGVAAVLETRFFKGSIGNALDLQMKLVREGEKLTGTYSYQKVGTRIDLRGSIDKDGNVTLQEFDPAGKQTGVFKGLWKQNGDGLIEIKGDWSKPNSDKKTVFALQQEPIEFSNGVEIVAKQIKEKNKKLKYEVDAAYPQLTGSVDPNVGKFNQTVRSLITRKVADFKKGMAPEPGAEATPEESPTSAESLGSDITIGYAVVLAKDDLVSLEFTVSDYEAGAAHPNSYTEVVNYDLKNGKQLKLADLFQPGTKYLQTLSTYCIQALKKQAKEQGADAMLDDDWIKKGAGAEMTNYENWTITRKGLGITFDPYQVAAYAAGPQNCTVQYAALKEIVRPDGPVGQFK